VKEGVGAGFEAFAFGVGIGAATNDNDGEAFEGGMMADLVEDIEAGHIGEVEVENDDIGARGDAGPGELAGAGEEIDGILAAVEAVDGVETADLGESAGDSLGIFRGIVNQEDGGTAGLVGGGVAVDEHFHASVFGGWVMADDESERKAQRRLRAARAVIGDGAEIRLGGCAGGRRS